MSYEVDLRAYGLSVPETVVNAPVAQLYEYGVEFDRSAITSSGALAASSGEKTGRSPLDKRIVKDPASQRDIWWDTINFELPEASFVQLRQQALAFLGAQKRLYVVDGFAGWDPKRRIKIRVICARPYHALFMHNMLIRPTADELATFGTPDHVIFNAGQSAADPDTPGVASPTSVSLSFERGEFVILGTQYAGEMKKGVFTLMHYLMPKQGVLSMHCSANEGPRGDVSLFFGLSGTGKTTLSADVGRKLIGDDEHCWTDDGVFNIEGGCYAKCIHLSAEKEPEIHAAIRFGTILENTVLDPVTREVDFDDASLTENTRAAYPIEFIPNAKIPCLGPHPTNIIFSHLRRLWRAAAGEPADAGTGHVSFHQRIHGQGGGHGSGRARAGGHVLGLFWRGVSGLASHQVRRDAGRTPQRSSGAGLAHQYRLVGRRLWHRQPHRPGPYPRHHRRHS